MGQIVITNPGVGALCMEAGGQKIFIDAFNTLTQPPLVQENDIILFTHDDGDHFSPDQLPDVRGKDIMIIGPPTIVKPILLLNKATVEQIEPLYTNRYDKPATISFGEVTIICYHTEHFNHWESLHNSYLIEAMGKRVYVTGDSLMTKEQADLLGEIDVVLCNLVDEGFLKGQSEESTAIDNTITYLQTLRTYTNIKKIIGTHLIGIEWTVNQNKLNQEISSKLQDVIIPISTTQQIVID